MVKLYVYINKETKVVENVSFLLNEKHNEKCSVVAFDAPTRNVPIEYICQLLENSVNGGALSSLRGGMQLASYLTYIHNHLQSEFMKNFIKPFLHICSYMKQTKKFDGRNESQVCDLGQLYDYGVDNSLLFSSDWSEKEFRREYEGIKTEIVNKVRSR